MNHPFSYIAATAGQLLADDEIAATAEVPLISVTIGAAQVKRAEPVEA
jgi:hypothetical protein